MRDPHKHAAGDAGATIARVAFGSVVNVRPIASRAVTRIEIEIPIEAHIEATSLLYGKDVLIVPVALQPTVPYGMTDGTVPDVGSPGADGPQGSSPANAPASGSPTTAGKSAFSALAGGKTSSAGRTATITRAPGAGSPMLGRRDDAIDIVRWLGIRCNDGVFQEWLGAGDADDAASRVREICDVSSRKEISGSLPARRAFFDKIYKPFIAHVARLNGVRAEDLDR